MDKQQITKSSQAIGSSSLKSSIKLEEKIFKCISNFSLQIIQLQLQKISTVQQLGQNWYKLTKKSSLNEVHCLQFKSYHTHIQNYQESEPEFSAHAQISIESNPIAPPIEELKQNKNMLGQSKSGKKKTLSLSPVRRRSASPLVKKKILNLIIKPKESLFKHQTLHNLQLDIKLFNFEPNQNQITYTEIINLSKKSIEIIQLQPRQYALRTCFQLKNQNPGVIHFSLNNMNFQFQIVHLKIFQTIQFKQFEKLESQISQLKINHLHLVRLADNTYAYPAPNTRIIKNFITQEITNGYLSSVFIKSNFQNCAVKCNKYFRITQINQKSGGYMIYFTDNQSLTETKNDQLVISLKSHFQSFCELHIFDCVISPRTKSKDTIFKELKINNIDTFYQLDMTMVTSENYTYNIISSNTSILEVVNGSNFVYNHKKNKHLIVQMLVIPELRAKVDLLFYDNRHLTFFYN